MLLLALPLGWQWLGEGQLEDLVPGQTGAAARSAEMALVTREEPAAPHIAAVDPFTAQQVQDVDGFISGETLLSRQRQKAGDTVKTLYQGASDHPSVSRWVHITPSTGLVWWRLAWRQGDQLQQVMAWAPADELDVLAAAMMELEEGTAWSPSPPMLLVAAGTCDETATVSRNSMIEASARHEDALAAIARREGGMRLHLAGRAILSRSAESCLTEVAPKMGVCRVYAGEAITERDRDIEGEVARCMDKREKLPVKLAERLDTVAAW